MILQEACKASIDWDEPINPILVQMNCREIFRPITHHTP